MTRLSRFASHPAAPRQDSAMGDAVGPDVQTTSSHKRRWVAPEISDLPRLTDLTLQTGSPIGGGGDTGGSSVF